MIFCSYKLNMPSAQCQEKKAEASSSFLIMQFLFISSL
jgi:hypothetical protein